MNGDEFGAAWRMSLDFADLSKARSVQQDLGVLGASDAGGCRHRAVLTVRKTPASDVVKRGKALIGSALHSAFLPDWHSLHPEQLVEGFDMPDLVCTLPSGTQVPVHPDMIDPGEPSVTDLKATAHLSVIRAQGSTEKQMMQRHLQALAAHQAGLLPDLSAVITRNLYLNMTDVDDWHVEQSLYDPEWIDRADQWYSDVRYAVAHDEDGATDGEPYFCGSFCQFKSICPKQVTDAQQRITSPRLAELVDLARVTRDERKAFAALEGELVEQLRGVTGRTDSTEIISTSVHGKNGTYQRVELRPVS